MTRLARNQGELSVLRPLLVFFNLAAFSFSAVVREMAPISSSLEKSATLNFLIMWYHAVCLENSHKYKVRNSYSMDEATPPKPKPPPNNLHGTMYIVTKLNATKAAAESSY